METGILITGETGTGKELVARVVHQNSPRASSPFVVVDCSALPESLIESALFGHEKGAFTGATSSRSGLIKQAEKGTLFLDEVGELPMSIQKIFLRVLQEYRFRPVGGDREIQIDFRLVAATHRDLDAMVEEGTFRKDLLYRLRSISIHLPPLRERLADMISLTMNHLEKKSESSGNPMKTCSPELMDALKTYEWPGNIRELENTLDHCLALAGENPFLHPVHLPPHIRLPQLKDKFNEKDTGTDKAPKPLAQMDTLPTIRMYRDSVLEQAERVYLMELMRRTSGRIKIACEISGLSESRLHALLKKYGTPRFR